MEQGVIWRLGNEGGVEAVVNVVGWREKKRAVFARLSLFFLARFAVTTFGPE